MCAIFSAIRLFNTAQCHTIKVALVFMEIHKYVYLYRLSALVNFKVQRVGQMENRRTTDRGTYGLVEVGRGCFATKNLYFVELGIKKWLHTYAIPPVISLFRFHSWHIKTAQFKSKQNKTNWKVFFWIHYDL